MKRYWEHLVTTTEKNVEDTLIKYQMNRKNEFEDGRIESEILEGRPTIFALTDALSIYFCEESKYYQDEALMQIIEKGMDFIMRWQRPDGSIDYPSCNFYSAPDTCFCMFRMMKAYEMLMKYGTSRTEELKQKYIHVIIKCVPILLYGGFHTPNHRWAVTAGLMYEKRMVNTYPEIALQILQLKEKIENVDDVTKKLQERIHQYLQEGIDGNEEGEYAERSTGIYNAVVDDCLIMMYEESKDESYLGYVERNLKMMLYYFDGDGSVFTQNSTRQDYGKATYPYPYFFLYAYMADKTKEPLFAKAAHEIIKGSIERSDRHLDCLFNYMVYDNLRAYQFTESGFLEEYRRYFAHSGVLRVKKPEYGYSVLNGKSGFLFIKFGTTEISLRIGESYCAIRNFIPENMEVTEKECILRAQANGWYYEPFAEHQGTNDWWEMDHTKRELIVNSQVLTTVTLKELEKGLEITIKTEGLDRLPLRVEMDVPSGVILENDTMRMAAGKGESMVLKDGYLTLQDGSERIKIGPGYGKHSFGGHYSGEELNMYGYTIYLNDYTPYERTFRIEREG